jgi:uncharacterized protein YdbL (DUF1318 family)
VSRRFLAFSYKPRAGTSNTRVALWRALRDLGAVYLQQGVALLPFSSGSRRSFDELKNRVEGGGGSATLSRLTFLAEEDEAAVVEDFNGARREEYKELAQNCASFSAELDRTETDGEYSFSELEEGSAELAKLGRWLERITQRDHFDAKGRVAAEAALQRLRKRLSAYEKAVFAREGRAAGTNRPHRKEGKGQ